MSNQTPDLGLLAKEIVGNCQGDIDGAIACAKRQNIPPGMIANLIARIKVIFFDQIQQMDELPVIEDIDEKPKKSKREILRM
ncbi:MAG: hypothetical protein PHT38_00325 [Halothiobacillus sp.]|nr:hypothetical protein [Halothiobacillus sp.]MDY0146521.1 hypothetical protein [Halothiobacillus sp.]